MDLAGLGGQAPLHSPSFVTSVWAGAATSTPQAEIKFDIKFPWAANHGVSIEAKDNDNDNMAYIYAGVEPDDGMEEDDPIAEVDPHFEPLPWWSPLRLTSSVVAALRWPFFSASLSRRPDVEWSFALASSFSLLSSLKWPFSAVHWHETPEVDWRPEGSSESDPSTWNSTERAMRTIPQYVLDHAPLVHLFSREPFWPCRMPDHLEHVSPFVNSEPLDYSGTRYNVNNLDSLNAYRRRLYLTSDDNVEDVPDWLTAKENIPVAPAHKHNKTGMPVGGRSDAPVTLIVVDKGNGIVDAFYMYFYCYNQGNTVLGIRFGDHVGDWEHNAIRFKDGKPIEVFFSQHIFGEAYSYEAVEKIGKRPVVYSATGTHAMYSTPAIHRYVLPWGLLHDETDRGPLWDPLLNINAYTFNTTSHALLSSTLTPKAPIAWFYFLGHWGDKAYPLTDSRQYYFAGQYHYVDGPMGPIYKNLARTSICINAGKCPIKQQLDTKGMIRFFSDGSELNDMETREVEYQYGIQRNLPSAS